MCYRYVPITVGMMVLGTIISMASCMLLTHQAGFVNMHMLTWSIFGKA